MDDARKEGESYADWADRTMFARSRPAIPPTPQGTARDDAYKEAVESGNINLAQRMVDDAANENGYTFKGYHGTNSFGFTQFNKEKSDDGLTFFFASTPADAS